MGAGGTCGTPVSTFCPRILGAVVNTFPPGTCRCTQAVATSGSSVPTDQSHPGITVATESDVNGSPGSC